VRPLWSGPALKNVTLPPHDLFLPSRQALFFPRNRQGGDELIGLLSLVAPYIFMFVFLSPLPPIFFSPLPLGETGLIAFLSPFSVPPSLDGLSPKFSLLRKKFFPLS